MLTEKAIPFKRIYIDLSDKPEWFKAISPLGKVPVLMVEQDGLKKDLFESAVILEYLDEVQTPRLHPADVMARACNRAWMEFGSSILNTITRFYSAPDAAAFEVQTRQLTSHFEYLEHHLGSGPFFNGTEFSLVDAVFAPIFRYFDVFDEIVELDILHDKPATGNWRQCLAQRESVRQAVSEDYKQRLRRFLAARESYLATLVGAEQGRVVLS